MKIVKGIVIGFASVVVLIVLAGMFKFNFLSGLEGYDVDGNKIDSELVGYVVEEEVDGPQDCTELETYDARRRVCYFECESQVECDAMEAKVDAALDSLEGEYVEFANTHKIREFGSDRSTLQDGEKAEVIYKIDAGEDFVLLSGNENAKHKKIKKWLAAISPDNFSDTYLARLVVLTDTKDDSAAYVAPSEVSGKWDIYVNMKSMLEDGEKEMVFTLIHEYAHILTLNTSQVDEDVEEDGCKYYVAEGCMRDTAYLKAFYFKYWDGKGFDVEVEDSLDNYNKAPDAFITEYAATNPGEDIAESFASFVFKKDIDTSTVAGQKLAFFYTYEELANIRQNIRNALKTFVRKRSRQY